MLMPLLTVRTASATIPVAAVTETARLHERMPAVPVRISGNQSEAVLKILETLNRHFIGSEPMPKEALIRLLDTLAKLLKFPPLPQESLRDFSKRLAVFLETLTPAARSALEKQLAQRNLGVSVRLLAEALKHPAAIDPARPSDRPSTPAPSLPGRTDGRSAPPPAGAQGQVPVPNRPAGLPMQQALAGGAPVLADAGRLQAALRQAFGNDDDAPMSTGARDESESVAASPARQGEQPAATPAARRTDMAAAQAGLTGKAGMEAIPLLRAAAAFLAADPQALSLVVAIAGEMDGQLQAELEQELGLKRPAEPEMPEHSEQPDAPEAERPDEQPTRQAPRNEEGQKAVSRDMAPRAAAGAMASDADPAADTATASARPQPSRPIMENTDIRSHGPDTETEPDGRTAAGPLQPEPDEAPANRPEKSLAQALKTLIESALPLPRGAGDGAGETPSALFSDDMADMRADALFARLDGTDDTAPQPRPAPHGGGQAEPAGFEGDGWPGTEAPDEEPSGRPAFAHPRAGEDAAPDARAARPETGFAREAIPFAMIPYLPAGAEDMRKADVDTEDRPELSGDEERDEDGSQFQDDGEEPEEEEEAAGEDNGSATEDGGDIDAGYGLYRRMGEIG